MAGREIYLNRKQLRSFSRASQYAIEIEDPFDSYKTTEVNITSEVVPPPRKALSNTTVSMNVSGKSPVDREYDRYTITIASTSMAPKLPMPSTPSGEALSYRKTKAAMEANTAAWAYTKCALLFFVSLLITWVSHDFILY